MRQLTVLTDGTPFAAGCRFHLSGKASVGLYPDLFLLECLNLSDQDVYRLQNSKDLSVMSGGSCLASGRISDVFRLQNSKDLFVMSGVSCLASGRISDVFRRTVPEGTITTVAFSLGLNLWEAQVSLSVPAGTTVSETVRSILASSGTGIQLLSFPGKDPAVSRAQAVCGRAAEEIEAALSRCSSKPCLVPAGLCIIPAEPLPATLHLTEKDLTDRPAFVDHGRKMILTTTVTGFRPGEEMTLTWEGKTFAGLILERLVDADTGSGPWRTQLLIWVNGDRHR